MKVISGGQTGIDQLALTIAWLHSIPTGGYAPTGWKTEEGPQEERLRFFNLRESPLPGYPARTELNVVHSLCTVWIGAEDRTGFMCTQRYAHFHRKPFIQLQTGQKVPHLLPLPDNLVVNFAGPRGSYCNPHFLDEARISILELFADWK